MARPVRDKRARQGPPNSTRAKPDGHARLHAIKASCCAIIGIVRRAGGRSAGPRSMIGRPEEASAAISNLPETRSFVRLVRFAGPMPARIVGETHNRREGAGRTGEGTVIQRNNPRWTSLRLTITTVCPPGGIAFECSQASRGTNVPRWRRSGPSAPCWDPPCQGWEPARCRKRPLGRHCGQRAVHPHHPLARPLRRRDCSGVDDFQGRCRGGWVRQCTSGSRIASSEPMMPTATH
jgi:hypothetical protein